MNKVKVSVSVFFGLLFRIQFDCQHVQARMIHDVPLVLVAFSGV